MRYEVIERYADNDLLIEMPISPQARKKIQRYQRLGKQG